MYETVGRCYDKSTTRVLQANIETVPLFRCVEGGLVKSKEVSTDPE